MGGGGEGGGGVVWILLAKFVVTISKIIRGWRGSKVFRFRMTVRF